MTPETPQTRVEAGALPAPERASAFSLDVEEMSIREAVRAWFGKLRSGDPGALPSVLGLIVLVILFSQVSDQFLSAYNIGNIPGQGAYIAVIAMGLVFVLLLGEIDLSAGTAGGACAAFAAVGVFKGNLHDGLPGTLYWAIVIGMALVVGLAVWLKTYAGAVVVLLGLVLVLTNQTQHLVPALIAAVCIGAAIGIFNGYLVAKVGIPSFVVTLALFLAWQGVLQFALSGQPVNTSNYELWHDLTYGNLSVTNSWIFVTVIVSGYLAYTVLRSVRAKAAGLAHETMGLVLARGAVIATVAVLVTAWASQNRNTNPFKVIQGIPVPAAIAIVLMIGCTFVLTKTTWGRHLYATGGNIEAARRAGIDVVHMKVTAFALCSAFGALGGIMLASSQSSASLDLGSGNVLLFSVAAAVIGGTSLFGGRGRPRDAILGALVIAIIPNGLLLKTSLDPQWQQVITGVVLLIAAAVDAVSRRRSARG
ncbi:ABC transporter permease [Nocardioides humilatus]|uniref:Xylose transport system permease protein XylH n=1 Tax=Nocardioides humilatus TaxID=2607660 RepID=A0A5B1LKD9_9ACTN|nr:ABC transporter permease [Nocardioides humilatus]KAA1421215.1 ABC transporter permease [Nocardioides humilatus]